MISMLPSIAELQALLACPMCHGPLDDLRCTVCHATYSRVDGIPSFVSAEMYASPAAYAEARRVIDFWGNGWTKRLAEPDHAALRETDRAVLERYADDRLEAGKSADSNMGVDLPMDSIRDKVVLNIGCGAGGEALLLARAGAKVIALDITAQAGHAAEDVVGRLGGTALGIQADSRYLPLADNSVDFVYSSGVLHHSSKIEQSVESVLRVLKPGGKAHVMLYATWSILFVQQRLMRSMGEREWETGGRTNPITTTYTKRECRALFANYANVRVRKTGESLVHLAKVGRFIPETLDRRLYPYLGPRLNITAEKPATSGLTR